MNTTATSTGSTDSLASTADAALLQLIWLASPALPVGGFSYSEGLEAAVEAGCVRDEASAGDWLCDQLQASLARADLAVVCAAVAAARAADAQRLAALDRWVRQTRETAELRQQSEQMGRSLAEWQKSLGSGGLTGPWTYPVAFAVAAAPSGASERQVGLAFAFAWAENMVQAAIRSVPLGQGAGQRILARLAGALPAAVDDARQRDDTTRQSFTPMLAILSAQHETQYSRLFRS
jgi:urease accessory protein